MKIRNPFKRDTKKTSAVVTAETSETEEKIVDAPSLKERTAESKFSPAVVRAAELDKPSAPKATAQKPPAKPAPKTGGYKQKPPSSSGYTPYDSGSSYSGGYSSSIDSCGSGGSSSSSSSSSSSCDSGSSSSCGGGF